MKQLKDQFQFNFRSWKRAREHEGLERQKTWNFGIEVDRDHSSDRQPQERRKPGNQRFAQGEQNNWKLNKTSSNQIEMVLEDI